MKNNLEISIGQCTSKGVKKVNQDFHGVCIPQQPMLSAKGIAIAIADGISSSEVSQIASNAAVNSFLADYYCTSESWTVKTSAQRVLAATNSWLHAQTRQSQFRFDKDKGYVCAFSAMVLKSTTAHLFYVGDVRIYRLSGGALEQLSEDHRAWVSPEKSYLSRAMGVSGQLEIDYRAVALDVGDVFILATDGIYEFSSDKFIAETINATPDDLDAAAKSILDGALQRGSTDNLTIQIVSVENLPQQNEDELYKQLTTLPFPPELNVRTVFDGYEILRDIYISSRSHVFLALDTESNKQVIIKTPSIEQRNDTNYLERFLMEEWVARRIDSAHVLKACDQTRKRNYLYSVTEFIDGQTLAQWIIDNPRPDIETVRGFVEQIAAGLRAFHRQEMLHQDLRPNNIMIDKKGTLKIIDFGAVQVAGVMEASSPLERDNILGTAQYTAPEYYLGKGGSKQSDIFSLGVITYQLLSGRLPYGTDVVKARTAAAQRKLRYRPVLEDDREIPAWVDEVIQKAVHPNPNKRYAQLSEFVYDLRHPNSAFLNRTRAPLMERSPVLFWKLVSSILAVLVLILLARQ
jgi:serine/threonine protein kinase